MSILLTNIKGGTVSSEKLVNHLICLVTSIKPAPNNAFSAVFIELKKKEPRDVGDYFLKVYAVKFMQLINPLKDSQILKQ